MKGVKFWKIFVSVLSLLAVIKLVKNLFIVRAVPLTVFSEESLLFAADILLLLFILIFKNRWSFLSRSAGLAQSVMVILLFLGLFAPLAAPYAPDFIINAGECRLLPPASVKQVIFEKGELELDRMIAADDIIEGDKVLAVRKNKTVEYSRDRIVYDDGVLRKGKVIYFLGTDEFGRDLLSRVIYGARMSLFIGLTASFISFFISAILAFAALSGGKLGDNAANRLSEIFLAVPSLFVIIFAVSFFGSGLTTLILILGSTSWMSLFKIINGEVKRIVRKNFIITSLQLGIPKGRVFYREILPLLFPSVAVNLLFLAANFIIVEASLSFLGLGTGTEYPSWGGIIESGITYLTDAWWLVFAPGVFLVITIIALNKSGLNLQRQFNPGIE